MKDHNYQSSFELKRARKRYYAHSILNGLSFRFVAGNIITLYALRLGAGNTYIGFLSSFVYASLLFIVVGRVLIRKLGAVRLQSRFWALRYLCMVPAVFTALPFVRSNVPLSFSILALAVAGFHSSKGIAVAGQKNILGSIVGEHDRGAFLSRLQSLNTAISTVAWLFIGFALGDQAPLGTYALAFIVGIVFGLGSSWALSRIPEPVETESGSQERLIDGLKRGFANRGFRRLVAINLFRSLLLGMTSAFLIVYFRRIFEHPDADVVYITLFGSFGVVAMATIAGFLMDKVGAKPLFFSFAALTALTMLPLIFAPVATSGAIYWILPCAVMFFYHAGSNGMMNCSQDYFFATVSPENRLNDGIIYSAASGIGGFVGAVGGGVFLDAMLAVTSLNDATVFRLYFAGGGLAFIALSVYIANLPDIGAYSIRNTLSILFSARDLRAVRLLRRLDKPLTADEEQQTIRAIAEKPSSLPISELAPKLDSPSFSVRAATLNAFRTHKPEKATHRSLIHEITAHEYTTAHIAAEIIGLHHIHEGIPALREALKSHDFMLSGKSMVSLAMLGDKQSIQRVGGMLETTSNPRLIIFAARALAIFKRMEVIPILLTKLEPHIAPFIRDEIILAIAEIVGMGDWFYSIYSQFTKRPMAGSAELSSQVVDGPQPVARLALEITGNSSVFTKNARVILSDPATAQTNPNLKTLLTRSLSNERLTKLSRFRFLLAAILVREALDSNDGA